MSSPADYIEIEAMEVEGDPEAVIFLFRPIDGGELTAQGMLDTFADFLLSQDPEAIRLRQPKGLN